MPKSKVNNKDLNILTKDVSCFFIYIQANLVNLSEVQIDGLAPDAASEKAGKKLSDPVKWSNIGESERVIWGEAQGSGTKKYKSQVDLRNLAYKCTCPSRKFPCKHCLGLLYLANQVPQQFSNDKEPDWVSEWMDKRAAKTDADLVDEPQPASSEDQAKKDKAKLARHEERMVLVASGVNELELWLEDLVRLGLLNLPQKKASEFANVAARMIDAKAPGLAGWVRSLANLDFTQKDKWLDDALQIIAKLNLIIKSFHNYNNLSEEWQYTIRTLIGWSQSKKELLANPEADLIKDQWLILGQERDQNDDLITERNWYYGLKTGISALILNFGTRFAPLESNIVPGVISDAQLAFFPSVWKQRAVVKLSNKMTRQLPMMPICYPDWSEFYTYRAGILTVYPWAEGIPFFVLNLTLIIEKDQTYLCDKDKRYMIVDHRFDDESALRLLSLSAGEPVIMGGIFRNEKVMPMGIIVDDKYLLL